MKREKRKSKERRLQKTTTNESFPSEYADKPVNPLLFNDNHYFQSSSAIFDSKQQSIDSSAPVSTLLEGNDIKTGGGLIEKKIEKPFILPATKLDNNRDSLLPTKREEPVHDEY
mmetsp:Transcript_11484/g.17278  ORF Transcript_11484/g.17278 Transcript_11484/m.17278 type:complete len:114 (+) Transcript_11484:289-630(+)